MSVSPPILGVMRLGGTSLASGNSGIPSNGSIVPATSSTNHGIIATGNTTTGAMSSVQNMNGVQNTASMSPAAMQAKIEQLESEKQMWRDMCYSLKGNIRVFCRIRPYLEQEEVDNTMSSKGILNLRGGTPRNGSSNRAKNSTIGGNGLWNSNYLKCVSTTQLEVAAGAAGTGGRGSFASLDFSASQKTLTDGRDDSRVYFFDHLFGPQTTNDEVFSAVYQEVISAFEGQNVSILAYGATGTGKTYTCNAIMERSINQICLAFKTAEKQGETLRLQAQLIEVYNEQIRDLLGDNSNGIAGPNGTPGHGLHGNGSTRELKVTEGIDKMVELVGARKVSLDSANLKSGLATLLQIGHQARATFATNIHEHSSRSHLVLTLWITTSNSAGQILKAGKLSFVDLAGSERVKKSEVRGDRLREAQYINKSLSALSDVIWAQERKVAHIPYRNSKLTHLLSDSLGSARTRTVLLVTLSPALSNVRETLQTLQFGSRLNSISISSTSRRSIESAEQNRLRAVAQQSNQEKESLLERLREKDAIILSLQKQVEKLQAMQKTNPINANGTSTSRDAMGNYSANRDSTRESRDPHSANRESRDSTSKDTQKPIRFHPVSRVPQETNSPSAPGPGTGQMMASAIVAAAVSAAHADPTGRSSDPTEGGSPSPVAKDPPKPTSVSTGVTTAAASNASAARNTGGTSSVKPFSAPSTAVQSVSQKVSPSGISSQLGQLPSMMQAKEVSSVSSTSREIKIAPPVVGVNSGSAKIGTGVLNMTSVESKLGSNGRNTPNFPSGMSTPGQIGTPQPPISFTASFGSTLAPMQLQYSAQKVTVLPPGGSSGSSASGSSSSDSATSVIDNKLSSSVLDPKIETQKIPLESGHSSVGHPSGGQSSVGHPDSIRHPSSVGHPVHTSLGQTAPMILSARDGGTSRDVNRPSLGDRVSLGENRLSIDGQQRPSLDNRLSIDGQQRFSMDRPPSRTESQGGGSQSSVNQGDAKDSRDSLKPKTSYTSDVQEARQDSMSSRIEALLRGKTPNQGSTTISDYTQAKVDYYSKSGEVGSGSAAMTASAVASETGSKGDGAVSKGDGGFTSYAKDSFKDDTSNRNPIKSPRVVDQNGRIVDQSGSNYYTQKIGSGSNYSTRSEGGRSERFEIARAERKDSLLKENGSVATSTGEREISAVGSTSTSGATSGQGLLSGGLLNAVEKRISGASVTQSESSRQASNLQTQISNVQAACGQPQAIASQNSSTTPQSASQTAASSILKITDTPNFHVDGTGASKSPELPMRSHSSTGNHSSTYSSGVRDGRDGGIGRDSGIQSARTTRDSSDTQKIFDQKVLDQKIKEDQKLRASLREEQKQRRYAQRKADLKHLRPRFVCETITAHEARSIVKDFDHKIGGSPPLVLKDGRHYDSNLSYREWEQSTRLSAGKSRLSGEIGPDIGESDSDLISLSSTESDIKERLKILLKPASTGSARSIGTQQQGSTTVREGSRGGVPRGTSQNQQHLVVAAQKPRGRSSGPGTTTSSSHNATHPPPANKTNYASTNVYSTTAPQAQAQKKVNYSTTGSQSVGHGGAHNTATTTANSHHAQVGGDHRGQNTGSGNNSSGKNSGQNAGNGNNSGHTNGGSNNTSYTGVSINSNVTAAQISNGYKATPQFSGRGTPSMLPSYQISAGNSLGNGIGIGTGISGGNVSGNASVGSSGVPQELKKEGEGYATPLFGQYPRINMPGVRMTPPSFSIRPSPVRTVYTTPRWR